MTATQLSVELPDDSSVSALLMRPDDARWLFVYAHGAGAPMNHAFMEASAVRFAANQVATLRYQFPYTEAGRRRPDRAPLLIETVHAAIDAGARRCPDLPLVAGGKSMGGRMTSQAMAQREDPRVRALVFVGFPLHPTGKEGRERALHLSQVATPMLFLQGTRDKLADMGIMRAVCDELDSADLHVVDGADHGFHVLKRSGRTDDDVLDELAQTTRAFLMRRTKPSRVPGSTC